MENASTDEPWQKRWKFVEALGAGGQGDTSIVTGHNDSSVIGVIKCLKESKQSDPKARRRMFQEVSNLRVLHGAGAKVPKVLDDNVAHFENAEPLFFVMELIQGKTLAVVVEEQLLKIETAIDVVLQLCNTLRYGMKERIIHRDIKPENIIVRALSPADVVMVDFGIARNEADASNVTEVGETFDNKFISLPERRGPDENKRDPRSDLTGLCAILLFCLTKCVPRDLRDSNGRPPHRLNNYTLDKIIPNEVQRMLLNAFFDRGFSWELDARFQTLDEITSRLAEVMNPNASIPEEDISVIAARESALLRKSDRTSQLADFRQPINQFQQTWQKQISGLGKKLAASRFHIRRSDTVPPLAKGEYGDQLESFFVSLGIHNHTEQLIIAYHFCSVAEECTIVRKIDYSASQPGQSVKCNPHEEPNTVVRYTGNGLPPFEILAKDVESTVARLMPILRAKIEQKSSAKS